MSKNTDPLRSNLANARGLGSNKDGVSHWWYQRVTAIAMAPLLVWFVSSLIHKIVGADRAAIAEWVASPFVAIALIAMFVALCFHARLGLQVVIEDYVHSHGNKITLLIVTKLAYALLAIISIFAIIKLHFFGI